MFGKKSKSKTSLIFIMFEANSLSQSMMYKFMIAEM